MLRGALLLLGLAAASAFSVPAAVAPGQLSAFGKRDVALVASNKVPAVAPAVRAGALESLQMSCTTARTVKTNQQPIRRKCMLLGKRANNAMSVSFSHKRNHKMQQVNLQWKRVWWPEGDSYVRLRLSTKAIKTLKTKPLQPLANKAGLDLNKFRSR